MLYFNHLRRHWKPGGFQTLYKNLEKVTTIKGGGRL